MAMLLFSFFEFFRSFFNWWEVLPDAVLLGGGFGGL